MPVILSPEQMELRNGESISVALIVGHVVYLADRDKALFLRGLLTQGGMALQ